MNPDADMSSLIEGARAAIKQVLAQAAEQHAVPFHGATEMAALPDDDREALMRIETESYRVRPEHAAIYFCLRSAAALLDVSQALLQQPANPSPRQRAQQSKRLVADTKSAGRAAYRAALILTDTHSALGQELDKMV